jgi:hypothetical protein
VSTYDSDTENIFASLIEDDAEEATISFGDDAEFVSRRNGSDNDAGDDAIAIPPADDIEEIVPANDGAPDFSDLFGESRPDHMASQGGNDGAPADGEGFTTFEKLLTDKPQPIFKNQNYYKILLGGEGDISKRVHQLLGNFLKAQDPQDRSMHRGRLTPAYWELASSIAGKVTQKLPVPKVMLLRFGILLPTAISAEQRLLISRIPYATSSDAPVFYTDEWLKAVAFGQVNASATDETKLPSGNKGQKINAMLEKTQGRYDAQLQVVKNHIADMQAQERIMKDQVDILSHHDPMHRFGNLPGPYSDQQRTSLSELNNVIRRLNNLNRQVSVAYNELSHISDQLEKLRSEEEEYGDGPVVDNRSIAEEMNTVRQMAKLCVGRQGNHFPMLLKQYFIPNIRDIATKENVVNALAEVEYLDPEIFKRTFKQQTNRIVPNVILIPCYGDTGICWEPFERHARATSRGRLAIPMYPKDLKTAIIAALGDLRWQVAKERAQHYWMEEGLTGWYYQDFSDKKKKGDVKDSFIQDYILWLTKEADGTQKLEREVRDIFWRYVPFPQDVKDKLRNRGFVYNELYKKDMNRAMSDGY